jgi:pyridoxine/pyridoxamine 5'-phosphate oxidase
MSHSQHHFADMRHDHLLTCSRASNIKLRNINHNPRVTLGLEVTDLGRDVRVKGTAEQAPGFPLADPVP